MPKKRHYAVVVGISHYPGYVDGDVEGPVADAREFREWLRDPTGGDLPEDNIRYLLSLAVAAGGSGGDPDSAYPTALEIDALFEPFWKQGLHGRVGERLYVFAAGHGISDPRDLGTSALLSADATRTNLTATAIGLVRRADWFRRHAAFDEIVLFADCCRSQLGYEVPPPPWEERSRVHPRVAEVRYLYGLATGYGQRAYLGQFGAKGQRGVFSQAVLRALREAQPDETGRVTGECLRDHIYNIHDSVATEGQVGATVHAPDFDAEHEKQLVFSAASASRVHRVTVTIQPHTGQDTLVVASGWGRDPDPIVLRRRAGATEQVELSPGFYKFSLGGTDRACLISVPTENECVL